MRQNRLIYFFRMFDSRFLMFFITRGLIKSKTVQIGDSRTPFTTDPLIQSQSKWLLSISVSLMDFWLL